LKRVYESILNSGFQIRAVLGDFEKIALFCTAKTKNYFCVVQSGF